MNSVTLVGEMISVWDLPSKNVRHSAGKINVVRPCKPSGGIESDVIDLQAWGKFADRLMTLKPNQVAGIGGMLERDEDKNYFVYVTNVVYYTNRMAGKMIDVSESDSPGLTGFAAVSEIPDF